MNLFFEDLTKASRPRQLWALAFVALGAMLVIILLFSPRYVLWPTLKIPRYNTHAETHRAYYAVLQMLDPFGEVTNNSNKVIEWRLLFPVAFHYLRLPVTLFLAMPWVGCLLVLWYVANLLWERTQDLILASAGTVLLGTTSWFFTSTGWLAYFDSWYVLGGLILAFSGSWPLVLLAAALTPWIDERILFMVPACLAARAAIQWHDTGRLLPDRQQWRILIAGAVPLVCYTLIRIAAVVWFDPSSREYLSAIESQPYPPGPLANGTWMGLRLAWVPVLALPILVAARTRFFAIGLGVVIAFSIVVALLLAADVSRSMSILMPIALAGIILMARLNAHAKAIIIALAIGNLLLPAAHVVSSFRIPIFNVRHELEQLDNPPFYLSADFHISQAARLYEEGQLRAVSQSLGYASELTDLPDDLADVIVGYGEMEERQGRPENAVIFYTEALKTGTDSWRTRPAVEKRLKKLQQSGERGSR